VRFAALAIGVAIVLTDAYYLQFLEPRVSRKAVAAGLLVLCAAVVAFTEWGFPRSRVEWRALASRAAEPVLLIAILALEIGRASCRERV